MNSRKLTTNTFIEKARLVHGDKYDYSKVDYINTKIKVIIICPEHGEFKQNPYSHLLSHGCKNCVTKNKRSNTEAFIEKAKLIHGNKYDYSKVDYINSRIKITIICPEHGEFEQSPNNHLSGRGCQKCFIESLKK